MNYHSDKADFRTGYIDFLTNLLATIMFFSLLSFVVIGHPESKKKAEDAGIRKNAELVILMEWPKDRNCDIDLYVKDPNGKVVYFSVKDTDLMHLERDDRGLYADQVQSGPNLIVMHDSNEETWTLRGNLQGKYVVNVHLYTCRTEANNEKQKVNTRVEPIPVTFKMYKVNPQLIEVKNTTVTLDHVWQEETAYSFELDSKGNVSKFGDDPVSIVKDLVERIAP